MDHIPVEVLNEIFIKLDLKDKLECMLVSRLWYNALDQYHLLDTLDISDRVFFKLKEMIERQPHRATQVEYLKMEPNTSLAFDKRIICNMFPNLRQIIFLQGSGTYQRAYHLDNPFNFTQATSKLEKITDFGECELTRQLARSKMCGNLISLEIDFDGLFISASYFIRELNNMPVLEVLKLRSFRLRLMDLETVHDNLSSIKSFKFELAVLASGDSPRNVIPAVSVVDLELFFIQADDLRTHIEFYNYAAKKYPSVINPLVVDFAIRNQDAEYALHAYNEGFFPFYQNMGPRAEMITLLNYCSEFNAFQKFDDFGIRIKVLGIEVSCDEEDVFFIEELVQSKQAKYIEQLCLREIDLTPVNGMLNLEALRYLCIVCNYKYDNPSLYTRRTIDFNQLIAACPKTLSNLRVGGYELTFNGATSSLICVETLWVEDIDLTPDLAKVIESSFPKLSTLELHNSLMDDVSIRLPEHNFKLIKIETFCKKERQNGFSVKTTSDNKDECYSLNHRTNKVVPIPKEVFDSPLVLNFTCASVEKIELFISRL